MSHLRKALLVLALFAAAMPQISFARILAEKVEEDLYFVVYRTNRALQGTFIFDTKDKNTRKLLARVDRVCVEEGFSYHHILTPPEIVRDEALKAYWEMYANGEVVTQETVGEYGTGRTNVVKRLVQFSREPKEGFDECVWAD